MDMSTAIISSQFRPDLNHSPELLHQEKDLYPDSRLIVGAQLDYIPSFYAFAIKAFLLPIRSVQHELVTLYFKYIHPMFPVVDELYFIELHCKYRGQEQLMDPSDFVIYHAITAAGFGVSLPSRVPCHNSNLILSISVNSN